jgi:hypothetical protein
MLHEYVNWTTIYNILIFYIQISWIRNFWILIILEISHISRMTDLTTPRSAPDIMHASSLFLLLYNCPCVLIALLLF